MSAGQSICRNRCLWLIHPIDHETSWKQTAVWLTARYKLLKLFGNMAYRHRNSWTQRLCATRSRKCLRNVFGSKTMSVEGIVATLYLFIVLKTSPEHNRHQEILQYTACSEAKYETLICWKQANGSTHSETNSYSYKPSEEISEPFNHAPDSDEPAPSSGDLEISFIQWSRRVSSKCWTTGWSQDFCWFVAEGVCVCVCL